MKNIWIVRHSIRADRVFPYFSIYVHDSPITEDGKHLAIGKANRLKLIEKDEIDIIYYSPYLRAQQTATHFKNIVNKDANYVEEARIAEGQDKNTYWMAPNIDETLTKKLEAKNIVYPESESHIIQRCQQFINDILKGEEKNIIIVTHGIIYNTLLKLLVPNYEVNRHLIDTFAKYTPRYCDLTNLKYNGYKWNIEYSDIPITGINC